jgi:hypothetical protein
LIPNDLTYNPHLHNADRSISGRVRSVFSTKRQSERLGPPGHAINPGATGQNRSNLKSLASSMAKLVLRGVNESADAFPPLKSVSGCLCFILDNYEVQSFTYTIKPKTLTVVLENDCMSRNDTIVDASG